MNCDFFKQVESLQVTGDLNFTIRKDNDTLTVSVLLTNEQCGDKAKNAIPPLILKGTADELDGGFFQAITQPLQTTSALLLNMEAYAKQQELARQQSAMEKDKADKLKRENDAKDKKYREAMQQVDQLEKEGRYRDAWMKVPDPNSYPEHTDELRKRREGLSAKFAPDLFGSSEPEQPQVEEPDSNEPEDDSEDESDEFSEEYQEEDFEQDQ